MAAIDLCESLPQIPQVAWEAIPGALQESHGQAQKEMAFEKMCRGWALGTKEFKKALIEEANRESELSEDEGEKRLPRYDGETLREANELQWELLLERCLLALDKTIDDCVKDKKTSEWKVLVAALLKEKTSATNV